MTQSTFGAAPHGSPVLCANPGVVSRVSRRPGLTTCYNPPTCYKPQQGCVTNHKPQQGCTNPNEVAARILYLQTFTTPNKVTDPNKVAQTPTRLIATDKPQQG